MIYRVLEQIFVSCFEIFPSKSCHCHVDIMYLLSHFDMKSHCHIDIMSFSYMYQVISRIFMLVKFSYTIKYFHLCQLKMLSPINSPQHSSSLLKSPQLLSTYISFLEKHAKLSCQSCKIHKFSSSHVSQSRVIYASYDKYVTNITKSDTHDKCHVNIMLNMT